MKSPRGAHHAPRLLSLLCILALVGGSAVGCARAEAAGPNLILLGMDGLDYEFTRMLMEQGRLPNFSRLSEMGGFQQLETAASPQSPVAWSNFITGLDSGGHGIFDFLHRDLDSPLPFGEPYQATSRQTPVSPWAQRLFGEDGAVDLFGWHFPLSGGSPLLARHGTPFWQLFEDNGVESTLVRMPANYPPVGVGTRELSGMGTPDLRGTSGEFTFFSTDRRQFMKTDISGGSVYPADVVDGIFEGTLYALDDNPFTLEEDDPIYADFTVLIDENEAAAKFDVGGREFLLQEGEWSGWVSVDFELIPYLQSMSGAVRFYLKSVRPDFELYVTPIQVDPMAPAMPIAEPLGFAEELAEVTGGFWTQEMPEDTKALDHRVFDIDDFLAQTSRVRHETIEQYDYLLDTWDGGFLFYYFGSADQVSHELWGITLDPEHPRHDPDLHAPYADVIPSIYQELDEVVGRTLDALGPDDMLVVMSDHGFASWRHAFHLNSWLVDRGYMSLREGTELPVEEFFFGVDWRNTQAYNVGIAGLYLNLRGRESQGVVAPGDRMELLEQIERDLLATVHPVTGERMITKVYIRERDFKDRGHIEVGPDIVVGFAKGVRGSGKSALGGLPVDFVTDNTEEWSGDHIMDHRTVPGILLSSRPLERDVTSLQNLAAALLAQFGVEGFPDGSEPITLVDEN